MAATTNGALGASRNPSTQATKGNGNGKASRSGVRRADRNRRMVSNNEALLPGIVRIVKSIE